MVQNLWFRVRGFKKVYLLALLTTGYLLLATYPLQAADIINSDDLTMTSTPPPTTTPTPQTSKNWPAERGINYMARGLVPAESIPQNQSDNTLWDWVKNFFGYVNPFRFLSQSSTLQHSQMPPELTSQIQPTPNKSDPSKLLLEGSTGIFGSSLPQEVQGKDDKKMYEQANFPEGIHPLTRQI